MNAAVIMSEPHWATTADDAELLKALREIDESDEIRTTAQESDFFETVVYRQKTPLTEKQRSWARDIVEKYLD